MNISSTSSQKRDYCCIPSCPSAFCFFVFFKEISNYCLLVTCSCSAKPLERSHGVGWIFLFFFFCLFLHQVLHTRYVHPFALFILYKTLSLSPIPHFVIPLNCLAFLLFAIDNVFHHIFTLLCYLTAFPISYFQFSDIFPKLKSAFDILVGKLSIVDMDTSIFLLKSLSSKHKTLLETLLQARF